MALTRADVSVSVTGDISKTVALIGGVGGKLNQARTVALLAGVGAGQADRVWAARRTIVASGTDDLDLSGALEDALGDAVVFAKVKAIIISAAAGNTNNVVVGAAAATQFVGPFGAATHTVHVAPGGFVAFARPDAAGWAVGAGASDLLRIANGGAGTSVEYDIIIVGTSA